MESDEERRRNKEEEDFEEDKEIEIQGEVLHDLEREQVEEESLGPSSSSSSSSSVPEIGDLNQNSPTTHTTGGSPTPPPPPLPLPLPPPPPPNHIPLPAAPPGPLAPAAHPPTTGAVDLGALLQRRTVLNHVPEITEAERQERQEKASLSGELATVLRKKQREKVLSERETVVALAEQFEQGFDSIESAKKALSESAKLQTLGFSSVTSTISIAQISELKHAINLLEGLISTCKNATRLIQLTAASSSSSSSSSASSSFSNPFESRGRTQSMPTIELPVDFTSSSPFNNDRKQDLDSVAQHMRAAFAVLMRAPETLNEIQVRSQIGKLRVNFAYWHSLSYEMAKQLSERVFELGMERASSIESLGKTKFDAMWRLKSAMSLLSLAVDMGRELSLLELPVVSEEAHLRSLEAGKALGALQNTQSKVLGYFQPDTQLATSVNLNRPSPVASQAPSGLRAWFHSCYHGNLRLVKSYLFSLLPSEEQEEFDASQFSEDVLETSKKVTENINIEDHLGDTGLHLAVRKRHPEVVRLLLSLGANPRHKDRRGDTTLHDSASVGSLSCCELILAVDSSLEFINNLNNQKETPLHLVCKGATTTEHIQVLRLLLKKGASVFLRTGATLQTPLQLLAIKTTPPASSKNKTMTNSTSTAGGSLFLNFRSYCRSSALSDVTFRVQGTEFPAHRIILCIQSKPFKALLESSGRSGGLGGSSETIQWKEVSQKEIEITEHSPAAFGLLLDYCYTGDVSLPLGNLELAFEVMKCSDMYLIEGLKENVSQLLMKQLSLESAFAIYCQASTYRWKSLWWESVDFVLNNYHEIEFADTGKEILFRILEELQNNINNNSVSSMSSFSSSSSS